MKDEQKIMLDEQENFLIEDDLEEEISEAQAPKKSTEEIRKLKRRKAIKKHLISALVMTVVSILLFIFGLIWQNDTSLIAITDALWLVVVIEFFIGWTFFVYNLNIFSSIIYSTKSFFLMITGKKPKIDYYTYMKKIEDDPIPSYYYKVIFISTFILLIPAVLLLVIYF
jgi:hypothetical protein